MRERWWPGFVPQDGFVGFARYAGFPYFFTVFEAAHSTRVGGLETYRQLHALYTGALPSEVL